MPVIGTRIGTGTDDFAQVIQESLVYVDKSKFIKQIIDDPSKVILITLWRRSGKTLNFSMLLNFLSENVNGRVTRTLFNGLAIATECDQQGRSYMDQHQGKYSTIFVTFKDVKEDNYRQALNNLRVLFSDLYRQHEEVLNSDKMTWSMKQRFNKFLDDGGSAVTEEELIKALSYLTEVLFKVYGKPVVLLIDEYDAPVSAAYRYQYLDKFTRFMENMLSAALKTNPFLHKGVMTGILRISKNNMLSGLNNLKVYTLFDERYGEFFGFTESEVSELLKHVSSEASLVSLRDYYNGYRVGTHVIYNPWSLMNCLQDQELCPYWVMTSNDRLLKEVLLNRDAMIQQKFLALTSGASIDVEVNINLLYEELMNSDSPALWTLLLFYGYLTPESVERVGANYRCRVRIPNHEVLELYRGIFTEWIKQKFDIQYRALLSYLTEGRVEEFVQLLSRYLIQTMSTRDLQAERDYHLFVSGLIAGVQETHQAKSNREAGLGFPDYCLIPLNPGNSLGIILEFKYGDRLIGRNLNIQEIRTGLHELAQEGLKQITERDYVKNFSEYSNVTEVLKIGIAFYKRCIAVQYERVHVLNGEEQSKVTEIKTIDEIIESEEEKPQKDPSRKRYRSSEELVRVTRSKSSLFSSSSSSSGQSSNVERTDDDNKVATDKMLGQI